MNRQPDYYRILHVAQDAPREIIQSSYRTLMQRLRQHPDLGGDHDNAALINEAYATLTNDDRRAEYDRQHQAQGSANNNAPSGESAIRRNDDYEQTQVLPVGGCQFCRAPYILNVGLSADALCAECESPLFLPEIQDTENSGARALSRFPKQQSITYYESWPSSRPCAAETRDISLTGMQFVSQQPLHEGQVIKVSCPACRAIARVARVTQANGTWTIGVSFLTLRFESIQGSFISARA